MQVWIGTAGYSYPDWAGDFYPKGLKSALWLNYYSRCFPLVEINFTFYRLPTAAMLVRMAEQTPAGFQFLVKLPQTISHEQDPRDIPAFRTAVDELHRRGQLLGLLCQLPQSTHDGPGNRAWLQRLSEEFAGRRLAVEFRHRSWAGPETPGWLADRGLDLVAVDVPDIPALYPRGFIKSGPRVYARLHSRDAAKWYAGEKDRYDYDYSDATLVEWLQSTVAAAPETDQALLLFNNCQRTQAVFNARRMATLFHELAPEVPVVEPFAAAPPVQRRLFE
jgi:uncharacterized protein YecE (DUF72 family)